MWAILLPTLITLYANYRAGQMQGEANDAARAESEKANEAALAETRTANEAAQAAKAEEARIATEAQQRAAKQAYEIEQQRAQRDYAILQQEEAARQAAIGQALEAQAPALNYFRNVVAGGTELTPAQQQYAADVRQQTAAQLASRLGGRSATAIASRAATDVNNATVEANRQRVGTAAETLANPNISGANLLLARGNIRAGSPVAPGSPNYTGSAEVPNYAPYFNAQATAQNLREGGQGRAQNIRENAASTTARDLATANVVGQGIGAYYANRSNQDLLDAIRRGNREPSAGFRPTYNTEWKPSYSLTR